MDFADVDSLICLDALCSAGCILRVNVIRKDVFDTPGDWELPGVFLLRKGMVNR